MELGYLSSVTRTNTRLRGLINLGLIKRLQTPFFGQSLFTAGRKASALVGGRIAPLLDRRSGSPRFIQHALSVTNVRIELIRRGATDWRFEQQLWRTFDYGGRTLEVRPDGLSVTPNGIVVVEVDLGHAPSQKLASKLRAYDAFCLSGASGRMWSCGRFSLLTVTTSAKRAARLSTLTPRECSYEHICRTFEDLKIAAPGSWS